MYAVFKLLPSPPLLWWFISLSVLSSCIFIDQAAGSRSLPLAANDLGHQPDFVVDLNVTNFEVVLKDAPSDYAIVEFYANWCPACRNYKPQYEKVARFFNGANAVHPGLVLMTRVDCAIKVNTNLCDKFSVSHYPMLFWGASSSFVSGSWDIKLKNNKSEIRIIDDGRTAERMLKWINKQLESSFSFEDEKHVGNDDPLQSRILNPGKLEI